MVGSLNKMCMLGNLGKDPEIRSMQNGKEIANLSVGLSESWKDKSSGERKEKTEWVRVVIFSEGLVKVAKTYLKKGSRVYIEGALQTRKWTDKDGNDKYTTEVVLQGFNAKILLLDKKGENQGGGDSGYGSAYETQKPAGEDLPDDGIPF